MKGKASGVEGWRSEGQRDQLQAYEVWKNSSLTVSHLSEEGSIGR